MAPKSRHSDAPPIERIVQIAAFRSELRTFLRQSEQVARRWRLTPQRFLLLLTIKVLRTELVGSV